MPRNHVHGEPTYVDNAGTPVGPEHYRDDVVPAETAAEVLAAFEAGVKGVTAPPLAVEDDLDRDKPLARKAAPTRKDKA